MINPNATVATLTAPLVDLLQLGLVIVNPPNPSTTCGGTGVLTAIAGGTSVSLGAGATIPANGFLFDHGRSQSSVGWHLRQYIEPWRVGDYEWK